jgi:hypothetical protein
MFTVSTQVWVDNVLTLQTANFETLTEAHLHASQQQESGLQSKIFNEANTLIYILPIEGEESYA